MDITVEQILIMADRVKSDNKDDVYTIEHATFSKDGMVHEGIVFFKTNDPECHIYPLEEMTVRAVRGGIE